MGVRKVLGFSGSVLHGVRLVKAEGSKGVHKFSGLVLQGVRLVKAEGSKVGSQVFRFNVAESETSKGCWK